MKVFQPSVSFCHWGQTCSTSADVRHVSHFLYSSSAHSLTPILFFIFPLFFLQNISSSTTSRSLPLSHFSFSPSCCSHNLTLSIFFPVSLSEALQTSYNLLCAKQLFCPVDLVIFVLISLWHTSHSGKQNHVNRAKKKKKNSLKGSHCYLWSRCGSNLDVFNPHNHISYMLQLKNYSPLLPQMWAESIS